MELAAADCRYSACLAILTAALLLSGCGHDLPSVDTEQIKIVANPDANLDSPVSVDLILTMDADALGNVADLSAAQWFREREQIKLAHPTGLRVQSFEVPPRKDVTYELSSDDEDAVGAFIFADFPTPGTHRARVDRLADLTVRLGKTSFTVEPGN